MRRGKTIEERFIGNANIFSLKERRRLLLRDNGIAPQSLCERFYSEVADKDTVTKMQYLDINMWLMGDILLKADKTSMANSLELRVPFLDKRVMALAQKLPLECRVNTRSTKLALREAARRTLPERTANKDKLGFPVPIRVWLKEEKYFSRVLNAFESEAAKKYFNTAYLRRLLERHRSGKEDNSRKIFAVYIFLVWYNEFFSV